MQEETSIRSVVKLGEIDDWLTYDIPRQIAGRAWKGNYRGQKQKWFAFRFTGNEREINILQSGRRPQAGIRRMALGADAQSSRLIIPFKRPVYETVVKEFSRFA